MESSKGKNLRVTISGGSHEPSVQVSIKGLPKGYAINFQELNEFMKRRAPGNSMYTTPRKEDDIPIISSGFTNNVTTGEVIKGEIINKNVRSGDYNLEVLRPGHADFTAYYKYKGSVNMSGGGPFSGRMTAPMCIAGGIALQVLKKQGIQVNCSIHSIGGDTNKDTMLEKVQAAKDLGDSVGGIVECSVYGLPAGLGGPMFDGVESILSPLIFGIPAFKGLEFGNGFD